MFEKDVNTGKLILFVLIFLMRIESRKIKFKTLSFKLQ